MEGDKIQQRTGMSKILIAVARKGDPVEKDLDEYWMKLSREECGIIIMATNAYLENFNEETKGMPGAEKAAYENIALKMKVLQGKIGNFKYLKGKYLGEANQ